MSAPDQYALITYQPGALYPTPEDNAYGPAPDPAKLNQAGRLLADGADPPMTFQVILLQPAEWGAI